MTETNQLVSQQADSHQTELAAGHQPHPYDGTTAVAIVTQPAAPDGEATGSLSPSSINPVFAELEKHNHLFDQASSKNSANKETTALSRVPLPVTPAGTVQPATKTEGTCELPYVPYVPYVPYEGPTALSEVVHPMTPAAQQDNHFVLLNPKQSDSELKANQRSHHERARKQAKLEIQALKKKGDRAHLQKSETPFGPEPEPEQKKDAKPSTFTQRVQPPVTPATQAQPAAGHQPHPYDGTTAVAIVTQPAAPDGEATGSLSPSSINPVFAELEKHNHLFDQASSKNSANKETTALSRVPLPVTPAGTVQPATKTEGTCELPYVPYVPYVPYEGPTALSEVVHPMTPAAQQDNHFVLLNPKQSDSELKANQRSHHERARKQAKLEIQALKKKGDRAHLQKSETPFGPEPEPEQKKDAKPSTPSLETKMAERKNTLDNPIPDNKKVRQPTGIIESYELGQKYQKAFNAKQRAKRLKEKGLDVADSMNAPTGITSYNLGQILSNTDDQKLIDKIMNNLDNPVLIREMAAEFQAKAAAEKRTQEEVSNDKQAAPKAKNTKKTRKKMKTASGEQAIAENKEQPPELLPKPLPETMAINKSTARNVTSIQTSTVNTIVTGSVASMNNHSMAITSAIAGGHRIMSGAITLNDISADEMSVSTSVSGGKVHVQQGGVYTYGQIYGLRSNQGKTDDINGFNTNGYGLEVGLF
ncbi:MAG: hypothetical protein ACPG5T_02525, partial [Endozoicomonas sp.]